LEAFSPVSLQLRLFSSLDGVTLAPGDIDGNGVQVGKQFAEIASSPPMPLQSLSILCYILKYVLGMHLRVSDEAETVGLDLDQFFDEQIGDWFLFDHTSGIQDGKMISRKSKIQRSEELVDGSYIVLRSVMKF